MRKLKLLFAALALLVGGVNSVDAATDVTASYIGDVTWIVNGGGYHGSCSNNHKESNGKGWYNSQTISGAHAFANPTADGNQGESWSPSFGSAGVMMGRTMVLPAGNYTLSFEAFACNATNSEDPSTMPSSGDAVAFLTGETNIDITNTASAGDATFHNVSFTFDVATDNTAYEFGVKKLTDGSKIDWCQIKNVKLELNSTDIFPVANNSTASFTYSGSQTWHTNTWSVEGQSDGSRFQVPFHELWVGSGGKLDDATISGTHTPTQTGVYKVSAWVRAANEAGGDVTGLKIFVGDAETDACTGSSAMNGKARLGTYTAMADGVSGTPFNYGFKIKDATINWLAFKNVTITYLGSLPQADVDALISQAEGLESQDMDAAIKSALTNAKVALASNGSVANYNALVAAISDATASAEAYAHFAPEKAKALALGMTAEAINAVAPNVKDLMVAEYDYVTTNYSHGVSLGTWTTVNATERSSQHWDGKPTSTYSEQNAGWGDLKWSCSYSQNLYLPAGKYVFKVAGRKSSDSAVLTLTVKNGATTLGTVNDFPNGDTGLGINTSGATDFTTGEGHTYANAGNGRGWQWRYVAFELSDPATVNVAVTANVEDAQYQWVGFCNATVQTDNADNVALMEALVALNDAKTAATLTKNTTNVGTGVFQLDATTNDNLWNEYETAKDNAENYSFTSSSTASEVNALVTALNTAISNYQNQAPNAPAADNHYYVKVATTGHAKVGNAIVLDRVAEYPVTSNNYVTNNTGFTLNASAAPNANLAQAVTFTQVNGNIYNISMIRDEGTVYLTYGSLNDSQVNWKEDQIQATTDATKKGEFKIVATATENVFNIVNINTNHLIGTEDGGNIYTTNNKADFTLAEASQATVNVTIVADVKYGTRIFPFAPTTYPDNIVFYSCDAATGNVLTLSPVGAPEANVPYILEAKLGSTGSVSGWGTAGATSYTAGWLTGVYEATAAPVGSYVLQNNDNKVGFYKVVENEQPSVGANRCYLTESAPSRGAYFFAGNDETTGIDAINALTSGKAEIYNASGVRVPALQKGMNIIRTENGTKKIMVK